MAKIGGAKMLGLGSTKNGVARMGGAKELGFVAPRMAYPGWVALRSCDGETSRMA